MSILKQKAKRMPCVHFQNDGESQTDSESEGTTADTSCGSELDRSFEMGPGNRQPVQFVRSQRPDLELPQNQHPPYGPELNRSFEPVPGMREPVHFVRTQRPDMEQPQSQQAPFRPELNRSFETGLGPRQPVREIQAQRPPYEPELNRSFETGYGPRHPVRFVRSQRPTHGPELNRSFETGSGPRQPVRFVRSQRPETHPKTTTPKPTTPKPTTPKPTTPSAKKEPVSSTGSEKEGDKSESLSRIKRKLNNGKDGHKQPFLARGDPSPSSRIATGLSRAPPQGRPANPSEESTWRHNVCSCSRNWEICCCGLFCGPCLAGKNAEYVGEDCCKYGCFYFWCCSLPMIFLRQKCRKKYGIRGTDMEDIWLSANYPCCVNCQLANEMQDRLGRGFQMQKIGKEIGVEIPLVGMA